MKKDEFKMKKEVYGYVNSKAVYSEKEFVHALRGFEEFNSDAELMAYAQKVTGNFNDAGWSRKFTGYYLDNRDLARYLTKNELLKLKELQKQARKELEEAEAKKEWKLIRTLGFADNSVEEEWQDKDGNIKYIMTVSPHGDAC